MDEPIDRRHHLPCQLQARQCMFGGVKRGQQRALEPDRGIGRWQRVRNERSDLLPAGRRSFVVSGASCVHGRTQVAMTSTHHVRGGRGM